MWRKAWGFLRTVAAIVLVAVYLAAQTPVAVRRASVSAREKPNSNSAILATLHRGDVLVIVDDQPYWYGVTLKDGRTAYVPKSACTVLPVGEPAESTTDAPPASSGRTFLRSRAGVTYQDALHRAFQRIGQSVRRLGQAEYMLPRMSKRIGLRFHVTTQRLPSNRC